MTTLKHLVFTPDRNHTGNDFKGAFKPESDRYKLWYESRGDTVEIHRIDTTHPGGSRTEVETIVEATAGIDRLAFFCHGWREGMQMGYRSSTEDDRQRLLMLAGRIYRQSTPNLRVALYACLAGKGGDGSFADVLFESLRASGCADVSVFAHTDAGHATRNADAILFSPAHPSGEVIAERKTPMYRRFDARLDDKADDLRWRAPYMTVEELRQELGAAL